MTILSPTSTNYNLICRLCVLRDKQQDAEEILSLRAGASGERQRKNEQVEMELLSPAFNRTQK